MNCANMRKTNEELRLFTIKPTKTQPGVYIMKDMSVHLFADKSVHGQKLECGPCELFGFGTGSLTTNEVSALKGCSAAITGLNPYRN